MASEVAGMEVQPVNAADGALNYYLTSEVDQRESNRRRSGA